MKKSDLENGMIIEWNDNFNELGVIIGDSIRYKNGYDELSILDENLRYKKDKKDYISAIYKVKEKRCSLLNIFKKENLELIWKRPREIDWSKVPKWTKVRCKGEFGYYNAYHYEYIPNEIHCFGHTTRDEFTFGTDPVVDYLSKRDTYEIHLSVEVKEEWYKE